MLYGYVVIGRSEHSSTDLVGDVLLHASISDRYETSVQTDRQAVTVSRDRPGMHGRSVPWKLQLGSAEASSAKSLVSVDVWQHTTPRGTLSAPVLCAS